MMHANHNKRLAAYKFLKTHYGIERADYLVSEGWSAVYADLKQQGFTWSERSHMWIKSTRPMLPAEQPQANIKRFDYAKLIVTCTIADVEFLTDYWRSVVSVDDWEVWNVDTGEAGIPNETTKLSIFIRKLRVTHA